MRPAHMAPRHPPIPVVVVAITLVLLVGILIGGLI